MKMKRLTDISNNQIWEVDGRESVISTHRFDTVAHIVEWLGKFGKTVFLTREEAEAALAKEAGE